jgi:hypothetical protein
MFSIKKVPLPMNTLLDRYSIDGAYVDCYSTEVPGGVSLPEFIFAFYTTSLFKLERWILKRIVSKPSTDALAKLLADGKIEVFAAWHVEDRSENELLMCDFVDRTRSWFMVVPADATSGARTRLYFGSAVVPIRNFKTGKPSLGWVYRLLLGFHKIYSVLLLHSAASRVQRGIRR